MPFECSKRVRKILRQLADTAYDREVTHLVQRLDADFARWRNKEIDIGELIDRVDRFSKGRERCHLVQRYNDGGLLHFNVAAAIVRGVLKPEEVPGDALAALESSIEFYRRGLDEGTIRFDETE